MLDGATVVSTGSLGSLLAYPNGFQDFVLPTGTYTELDVQVLELTFERVARSAIRRPGPVPGAGLAGLAALALAGLYARTRRA